MQRRADAHHHAAFDLRHAIERVDRLADVVGRRHAQYAHAPAIFIDGNLSGLRCIHVKSRCMIAVTSLEIQIFAYFVGVRGVAAHFTVNAELAPDDFADRQSLLWLVFQENFTVCVVEIFDAGFEHRARGFHDLLACVDRGAAHCVAHVISATARGRRRVEWNDIGVELMHVHFSHRNFEFLGGDLRKNRVATLADFHRAGQYRHFASSIDDDTGSRCGR